MKGLLTIAIFLFLLSSMEAQHHLDQTSTWVYYTSVWQGPQTTQYYRTITIDGDSTIQGQTYFKRYIEGVDIISAFPNITNQPIPRQFLDLVRDDASAFYMYLNGQDSLVMDFTKMAGDTVSGQYCMDSISQIDTLFLGSTPLKMWNFYNYGVIRYIEGVGKVNNYDLENPCLLVGNPYNLVCYEKQGEQFILDSTINCRVYNSIVNADVENIAIKVYPNPTSGEIQIEQLSGLDNRIEIIDMSGKLLFVQETNQERMSLNMTTYPKGAYFLRIISKIGIETKKVIKI